MATKKREIYARAAVQLRTHDRPREAEEECPGAMGLYLFLLLQARGEQTHGDVSRAAARESWGAPSKYRDRQAAALIKAGLVEERDGRLVVIKYDEHNDTPDDIASARANTRERVRAHRSAANDVTRYMTVTEPPCNGDVPSSISYSLSGSDLESRSEDPPRSPREPVGGVADNARGFAPGTASAWEARRVFESAVAAATGKPFALAHASFLDRDLCLVLNTHAPASLTTKLEVLRWLPTILTAWIRSAEPATVTPVKLLDWLNAGSPKKRQTTTGGGPRGDRQPLGDWRPPASIDDDPFAPTGSEGT